MKDRKKTLNWVRTFEGEYFDYIESIDGIDWADAPLPPRLHECKPQTRGWIGLFYAERCACGAVRLGTHRPWMEKNQTRNNEVNNGQILRTTGS